MTDRIRSLSQALFLEGAAHLDAICEIIGNDGTLDEDTIELQVGAAKLCDEIHFHLCDNLIKLGRLPEYMRGYEKERQ